MYNLTVRNSSVQKRSKIKTERQRLQSEFIRGIPCGFVIDRDRSTS